MPRDPRRSGQVGDVAHAVTTMPHSVHEASLEWLREQPGLLDEFEGQWVAVADCRIVAASPSAIEVVRIAHEQGVDDPLLIPVMPFPFIGDGSLTERLGVNQRGREWPVEPYNP